MLFSSSEFASKGNKQYLVRHPQVGVIQSDRHHQVGIMQFNYKITLLEDFRWCHVTKRWLNREAPILVNKENPIINLLIIQIPEGRSPTFRHYTPLQDLQLRPH